MVAARPSTDSSIGMLSAFGAAPAWAVLPHERLADPALEARARALSLELRCQVCQNQSIDDSNAPLAADLRRIVRERLSAGDSDPAVLDFVVRRYGDYVLLKPPFSMSTLLLWGTPFAVLLIAGAALMMRRRRVEAVPEAPLSEAERRALERIME